MIRQGARFTEAARAAAAQKRRERAALKAQTKGDLEVFVLRSEVGPTLYGWEIRQFGGVVVSRSRDSFGSLAEARADGMDSLAVLPETHGRPTSRLGLAERALRPEPA